MTKEKPHILITNDDGIEAKGLYYLWEALKDFARITIVAPSIQKSGSGLGITFATPMVVNDAPWPEKTAAWHVSGTPADCVKVALTMLLTSPPDLIVSGINHGTNSGRNVLYSGTIGGVIEGALRDIPGLAFSACQEDDSFAHVKKYIRPVVEETLRLSIPHGTLFNVNFPCHIEHDIKGFRIATQGRSYWLEDPVYSKHPEGHSSYLMGGKWAHFEEEHTSDVSLLREGYVTIVPLHVSQLTDQVLYTNYRQSFEKDLNQRL